MTLFVPCALRSQRAKEETVEQLQWAESQPLDEIVLRAPQYGADTVCILRDWLQYSELEIRDLLEHKVVATSYNKAYLPGGDPWQAVHREYELFLRTRMLKVAAEMALMVGTLRGSLYAMRENFSESLRGRLQTPRAMVCLKRLRSDVPSASLQPEVRILVAPPIELLTHKRQRIISDLVACSKKRSHGEDLSANPDADALWAKRATKATLDEEANWRAGYNMFARPEE